MKVWIVTALTAEQWEDYSWVDSVHASKEAAENYIQDAGDGVLGAEEDEFGEGYYLSTDPQEMEVLT